MRRSIPLVAILLALDAAGCAERVVGPGKPTGHTIVIVSPTTVPDTTTSGEPGNHGNHGLPPDTGSSVVIIIKRP